MWLVLMAVGRDQLFSRRSVISGLCAPQALERKTFFGCFTKKIFFGYGRELLLCILVRVRVLHDGIGFFVSFLFFF